LQTLNDTKIIIHNKESKLCFVGISLGESGSAETGIAVLDRNLNLLRVDKSYNLSDLKLSLNKLAPPKSIVACIGLPRNVMMLNGKWRIESKQTQPLNQGLMENSKHAWVQRFSDRGSELCKIYKEEGMDIFRYNSYYTKNMLYLNPPYRSKSPIACKYLQMIIETRLGVSGMPTNLIPLPALNAVIGAYTAWKIATSEENVGYKQIGSHKNMPVVSAV